MNLPVYHRRDDGKLQRFDELKFVAVGAKHELVALFETVVEVRHARFTGQPHPTGIILPAGLTTTFELREDMRIYVRCDQAFHCEGTHGHSGPYETFDCEANKEVWISGVPELRGLVEFAKSQGV